jgi:subfamily B ATP-binding cassette protein MsbA
MTEAIEVPAPGLPAGGPARGTAPELDARSNALDLNADIGFLETVSIIRRVVVSYWPLFPWRLAAKTLLQMGALLSIALLLPWQAKAVIDHVVLGSPIAEAAGYPAYLLPVLGALEGKDPMQILMWLSGIALGMVLILGFYASGGARDDGVEARMEEGHDIATATENAMNEGFSHNGGLWGYVEFTLQLRLTQAVNHVLRSQLFSRLAGLSMTQLEDQRIGDSVYRVMYDTPAVTTIFYEVILTPTGSLTIYIGALLSLASAYPHAPEVIWISALIVPVWLGISACFSRITRRLGQAARASGSITTSTVEEGMDNILAVQSLGGRGKEKDRFGGDSKESFKRHRAYRFIGIIVGQFGDFVNAILQTAVFVVVAFNVIDGVMTPGDFGAMFVFWGMMRGPAFAVAGLWIRLQGNVAGMRRVFALMDMPGEDDRGAVALPPITDGITMEKASLVYPDGRQAIADVDLEAKVGEIVAFVGPTGAGKTSLAYLIPRFHGATSGTVRIDGQDVADVTLASLRSQVTYVFQETQLLSDSILDNIRYGKPEAALAEVEGVAKVAGAHDFIASLPEGYDTKLGSASASKLSVGQKQRIAIARGLLRDAKVLILDEPTSALDPETEEYLVQSLHEAARDRLVIIIAHRLSTIVQANKIVFLEEGRVVEQGTHGELMAVEGGHYRRFVDLQTGASLP